MESLNASVIMRRDPYELPALIGSVIDPSVRNIFSSEFIICSELFDLYIIHKVLKLVEQIGIAESVAAGAAAEEIVADKNFALQAVVPIRWFIEKLRAEGILSGGPWPF